MHSLTHLLSDPAFLQTLSAIGFSERELEAGRRKAATLRRPVPGSDPADETPPMLLGPESTWALDGTEQHGTPGYRCSTCRDSGRVRLERAVGEPGFGQAVPCACVEHDPQALRLRQTTRLARSGLDPALQIVLTLDHFEPLPGTELALDGLRGVLESHRLRAERGRWLVLFGPPGRGKTHLLAAAVPMATLLDRVSWANTPDLLALMAADNFARADELTAHAMAVPILILDEVGSQGAGEWVRERLERILNHRYVHQATTLVALTVPLAAVEDWSPRLASRFGDVRLCRSVELGGEDYRRRRTR